MGRMHLAPSQKGRTFCEFGLLLLEYHVGTSNLSVCLGVCPFVLVANDAVD
jgi:hypothetical protein